MVPGLPPPRAAPSPSSGWIPPPSARKPASSTASPCPRSVTAATCPGGGPARRPSCRRARTPPPPRGSCPVSSSTAPRTRSWSTGRAARDAPSSSRSPWPTRRDGESPMHASAMAWATAALTVGDVKGAHVVEAGAYDVNGSVRGHVEALGPASYTGTDMRSGPGVDVVCDAADLPAQLGLPGAHVIVSTELLHHPQNCQPPLPALLSFLLP